MMPLPPLPDPLPLPPLNAATLLRLLARRPRAHAGTATPATRYRLAGIDPAHVARYRARFGFAADGVPLTWWYLLAQRAHLATMMQDAFPFHLPGAVHASNALRARSMPDPGCPLLLETGLTVEPAAANGSVRVLLETVATQDGAPVFDCSSTYVVVRGAARTGAPHAAPDWPAADAAPLAAWRVAPDDGRRYAALSGDWNPIHLWPWSARLMGLRRPIIHGMHTLGHACAALERAGGAPLAYIDARFRAPMPLGSEPALYADAGARAYAVMLDGRIAVFGSYDTAGTPGPSAASNASASPAEPD